MEKLINYSHEIIFRGHILRCKAVWPYEDIVDFLICETYGSQDKNPYQLIVSSGYKAGLRHGILPLESIPKEKTIGLSTKWLIENWVTWGYSHCPVSDVYILESPIPVI